MSVFYRFRDLTIRCAKIANFYAPPVFNAAVQCDLSEFMRNLYNAEIYGHGAIFLPMTSVGLSSFAIKQQTPKPPLTSEMKARHGRSKLLLIDSRICDVILGYT